MNKIHVVVVYYNKYKINIFMCNFYCFFSALEYKHHEEQKTLIDQWGLEKDQLLNQNNLLNNKLEQVQSYENDLQSELLKNKKVGLMWIVVCLVICMTILIEM